MDKANNNIKKITILIGKGLLKTSIREPKVTKADITLVSLTSTLSKKLTDGIKQKLLMELHALPDDWFYQTKCDLPMIILCF